MATATIITAEEFARMETPETEHYELVDGELILLSSGKPLHSLIRDRATQLLRNYFDGNGLGGTLAETDCRINDTTVRQPDLSVFLGEHWETLDLNQIPIPFAPDIAIEVLSPSEHVSDVTRKVRDYISAGSREVWLLDTENIEIHVRTESGIRLLFESDMLDSPLLPGFSVNVSKLLAKR